MYILVISLIPTNASMNNDINFSFYQHCFFYSFFPPRVFLEMMECKELFQELLMTFLTIYMTWMKI